LVLKMIMLTIISGCCFRFIYVFKSQMKTNL
jgi:hypothetical protein